eukprot:5797253-Alexandrium_andersonii.AAC.1
MDAPPLGGSQARDSQGAATTAVLGATPGGVGGDPGGLPAGRAPGPSLPTRARARGAPREFRRIRAAILQPAQ